MADLLALAAGLGLGAVLALTAINEPAAALHAPGGWWSAAGRLSALVGTYFLLLLVVLVARLPWLERTVGQDRLVRWHRRLAPWTIALISVHVVTITVGYARAARAGLFAQVKTFLLHYPDLLAATVGYGLLLAAGVASIPWIRHHLKYETWWVVHLYLYGALALAFAHQITTGIPFLGHPLARDAWIALTVVTALLLLFARVAKPVVLNARLRLRVYSVIEEVPGTYIITVEGRHLERLPVSGGQFFQWRFLARDLWWHSHPYSLSAAPRPPFLRVTVKGVGDHSSALAHLRRGTRVFVEGPYGTFTAHARETGSVTLIGAGVGVTPLRAMLEDLPVGVATTMILRAPRRGDLVHVAELEELVAQRGGTLHTLYGSRHEVPLNEATLRRLAPGIASGDVYVCGPNGFTDHVLHVCARLGVPRSRLHFEAFSF